MESLCTQWNTELMAIRSKESHITSSNSDLVEQLKHTQEKRTSLIGDLKDYSANIDSRL